ncbi:hypothetical protein CDL12_20974 [Handroanthus impetiginosus]|uniref:RanBP2-type domain-containing protein n=1 Tax=Handroanthus impetiginosus TaxID=429701 RepID=A0A2G9GMI6_9LAMI|nr:hypothetical protein CDL12_20974 [Handroanthus impetiginosus]
MGGATRFMTLLTAPFPPLRPSIIRLHRRVSSLSATPLRFLTVSSPSKTKIRTPQLVNCFHSQPSNNSYTLHSAAAQQQQQHHPWPEWTHFLNILSNSQGFSAPEDYRIPPEDAFVVYEKLPDDFVRAAAVCIAFARARPDLLGLLSRKDIEAVVLNGTPFLFKSALDTARRMRAFLGTDGSNVSEFDKANTVDLMKYILSYASNPTVSSERNGLYSRELVDSSVRNLLHELATVSSGVPAGNVPASVPQFPNRDGQIPRPFGQNIEMKRGDWICPKCNFMNFARNMKCLECEEARPKRQLTGGEWECPQCNFFNYGRNVVCLRCDCRRPGAPLFNNSNSQSSSVYNRDYSYKTNMDNRLVTNEEKAQQWFSKISQMNNATDANRAASNEDFPEIMPLRKGENRVVSTRKTPLERKLANSQHENNLSNNGNATDSTLDTSINCSLDNIFGGGPSTVSERANSGFTQQNLGTKFSHPVDTFSRREQTSKMNDGTKVSIEAHESRSSDEKEQDEKSERWFKKMAELHNVKDLPSAVSDEDFPEIMPMRKGENRFVVSKKKDRSLTSPKYKRQVAMDQANNTNFVPFVPFPPGYFARKDTEQPSGQDSPVKAVTETSSSKNTTEAEKSDDSKNEMAGMNDIPRIENQPMSSALQSSPAGSTAQSSFTSHTMNSNTSMDAGAATGGPSSQMPKDENVQSGWTGKSLEGSAVKETDPLDMSEEAKAERWFKRVAQIKDISELSQIPDEDFPSIMPMRKGVNRFVVSKRKTPLERRLTSQQYRRNLPIVSNDSVKKETDNS